MNNYVKLYDYTMIFVEFYIANKNQRQGLHHASRAAAAKTRRLPPPLSRESLPYAANKTQKPPPPQIRCRCRTMTQTPAAATDPLPPPHNDTRSAAAAVTLPPPPQ